MDLQLLKSIPETQYSSEPAFETYNLGPYTTGLSQITTQTQRSDSLTRILALKAHVSPTSHIDDTTSQKHIRGIAALTLSALPRHQNCIARGGILCPVQAGSVYIVPTGIWRVDGTCEGPEAWIDWRKHNHQSMHGLKDSKTYKQRLSCSKKQEFQAHHQWSIRLNSLWSATSSTYMPMVVQSTSGTPSAALSDSREVSILKSALTIFARECHLKSKDDQQRWESNISILRLTYTGIESINTSIAASRSSYSVPRASSLQAL